MFRSLFSPSYMFPWHASNFKQSHPLKTAQIYIYLQPFKQFCCCCITLSSLIRVEGAHLVFLQLLCMRHSLMEAVEQVCREETHAAVLIPATSVRERLSGRSTPAHEPYGICELAKNRLRTLVFAYLCWQKYPAICRCIWRSFEAPTGADESKLVRFTYLASQHMK